MKATERNKPARKQSGKDLPGEGKPSKGVVKGKGNLSSNNVMGKSRSNQDAEEGNQSQNRGMQEIVDTAGFELDEDIRNDIEQTEVNPHAKRREPINKEREQEGPDAVDLNEDTDVVNEQEDDKKKGKYNKY